MKNMEQLFKSILDQDKAPIVVCDMNSIIVYMNPSAITRYKKDLTGKSLRNCHPASANEQIEKVLDWFGKNHHNNIENIYYYIPIKPLRQPSSFRTYAATSCCGNGQRRRWNGLPSRTTWQSRCRSDPDPRGWPAHSPDG